MQKISVVMPTYNQDIPSLKAAIDSILNQTFRDFEFIIVDDGSTDESRDYLDSLADPRIRIIRNERNIGVTKSLNIGFSAARGKYIARMDSDDFSHPDRFQKQYDFMESHPDVIVCGSRKSGNFKQLTMEEYRVKLLFCNPGPLHPSAFFNREKLVQYGLKYDESLKYAQDYGLWADIAQHGKIYISPEILVDYKSSPRQISRQHREEQIRCDQMTQKKMLLRLVDSVSDEELDLHYHYSYLVYENLKMTPAVSAWYRRLIRANNQKKIYDKALFNQYVRKIVMIRRFPIVQKGREAAAIVIRKLRG